MGVLRGCGRGIARPIGRAIAREHRDVARDVILLREVERALGSIASGGRERERSTLSAYVLPNV